MDEPLKPPKTAAEPPPEAVSLLALADHLDPGLAHYLRRLLAADSDANRYDEMHGRAERAEDLVAELRRIVASLEGQLDRARAGTCPARDERDQPCYLPDTARAHHDSDGYAHVAAGRASWPIAEDDRARWMLRATQVWARTEAFQS